MTMIFFLSFTCITVWIMSSIYKAVVVNEYALVKHYYEKRPPSDLLPDPWPSMNPITWAQSQGQRFALWRMRLRREAGVRARGYVIHALCDLAAALRPGAAVWSAGHVHPGAVFGGLRPSLQWGP